MSKAFSNDCLPDSWTNPNKRELKVNDVPSKLLELSEDSWTNPNKRELKVGYWQGGAWHSVSDSWTNPNKRELKVDTFALAVCSLGSIHGQIPIRGN